MFTGIWTRARDNKENIFYTILTIFLLERVRTGWNRIGSEGKKSGASAVEIVQLKRIFAAKAALLYALPFLLPVLKYIYRSIDELSRTVEGLVVMKGLWAFAAVAGAVEVFLALIIYNLLRIYIDRMNAAVGFFGKIGRNIWDGSKVAVQMGGDLSSKIAGGFKGASVALWRTAKTGARRSVRRLMTVPARIGSSGRGAASNPGGGAGRGAA